MSVSLVVQRLADMYALISGVKSAYPYIPPILITANLPTVVIEPGAATYDRATTGTEDVLETRQYRAILFFDLAMFGTAYQTETGILPLFNTVRDYFLARPGLELDTASEPQTVVFDATIIGDSGFTRVDYPTGTDKVTPFGAVTFTHVVKEWCRVQFQD